MNGTQIEAIFLNHAGQSLEKAFPLVHGRSLKSIKSQKGDTSVLNAYWNSSTPGCYERIYFEFDGDDNELLMSIQFTVQPDPVCHIPCGFIGFGSDVINCDFADEELLDWHWSCEWLSLGNSEWELNHRCNRIVEWCSSRLSDEMEKAAKNIMKGKTVDDFCDRIEDLLRISDKKNLSSLHKGAMCYLIECRSHAIIDNKALSRLEAKINSIAMKLDQ